MQTHQKWSTSSLHSEEESEEASDEASTPVQDTCAYGSVSNASKVKVDLNEDLPMHNIQLHRRYHICMESEESAKDDDDNSMSKDQTQDKETLTAYECLHILWQEVLVHQETSKRMPGSTSQILNDQHKLWEASTQLAKEAKKGDLDVIVWAHVATMIGLLNIYTDDNLGYSWIRSSEIIARTQGHGTSHTRCICEWAVEFLEWGHLPLHQLNQKWGTLVDDEDIAQEIKTWMMEKARGSFLKAQDVVEIVASPDMQAIFSQKGITKPTISIKMALCWLDKLG